MWFLSIGSDIYVFICMGFVLVELFDVWVYSFYNGGYLSGANLGVLSYNMWWLVNLIFPLPFGLFGISWSSKISCLGGYFDFAFMGLLMI